MGMLKAAPVGAADAVFKQNALGRHTRHGLTRFSAKITNYQEFSTRETFFDKDTLTDEEKKIDQELSRLVFEDSKGSKLFFELQVLDRLDEYKNLQNEDSISLMPSGIFYIVEKDMRMMGILLLICFAYVLPEVPAAA